MKQKFYLLLLPFSCLFVTRILTNYFHTSEDYFPDKSQWLQFDNPEEAGFNSAKIKDIKGAFDSLHAHSFLALYKGKVLLNWGDNARRMRCASIRKSLLSALIGIQVDQHQINLEETVCNINLDAFSMLDSLECTAQIKDLLTSTSGIYLPAAYEPEIWTKRKPARGSHAPGKFWYYNNWDFNVLGTIYEHFSSHSIAFDFNNGIAVPTGMQDYRPEWDFKYFFEADIPVPAYLFKLSTRDLARFGLLYLRQGRWKDQQIVPSGWVSQSTTDHAVPWENTGYGYLWWRTQLKDGTDLYYASGSGTQGVFVLPSRDLVVVFRADTYLGPEISSGEDLKLVQMLCDAQMTGQTEKEDPKCSSVNWREVVFTDSDFNSGNWIGKYRNNIAREISIDQVDDHLILETKIADFLMHLETDTTAWIEDLNIPAFLRTSEQKEGTSILSKENLIIYK
ncbi:MAG: serine hydrolase [Saprospiraceae bacterium]|nr:serine hydrolase [Saprospiraceae bacterium]